MKKKVIRFWNDDRVGKREKSDKFIIPEFTDIGYNMAAALLKKTLEEWK